MKVLLVHGLGRTQLSLALLGRRLTTSGHETEYFSYFPWAESQPRIVARLVARFRRLAAAGDEVGLVGHSFGGLLLREAVVMVPGLRVKHLVMLGTPNRQPRLALVFYRRFPYRFLRGSCGQCLTDSTWDGGLPAVSVPFTCVAGTAGWRGGFSPFGREANDGVVAVSETLVTEDNQPILLPAFHTFLMNSRSVHELIVDKLRQPQA